MKKFKLIQSLRDLAAIEAKDICAEDKPYFRRFVDAYEKKLLDDIVQKAIDRANMMRVLPVLYRFFDNNMDIPIPFDLDEEPVNQIMTIYDTFDEYFRASFNGELWYKMEDGDIVRLYEALDKAGYLDNLE